MSEGIHGVRVQLEGTNPADSATFIAGYLGFENTTDLWSHLQSPDVQTVLDKYFSLRKEGSTNKALDALNPKLTHFVFRSPIYADAIAAKEVPQENEIIGKDTLPYAVMVWIACRLLEEGPEILVDSKVFKGYDLPKCISPEDFNRALHLLRFAWKQHNKSKKSGAKGGRQKRAAAKVKYTSSNPETAEKLQTSLHLDAEMLRMMAEDADAVSQDVTLNDDDFDLDSNVITSARSSQGRTRPRLTPELQEKMLDLIGSRVQVLSEEFVDPNERQLEIFHAIAAEAEEALTNDGEGNRDVMHKQAAMLSGVSAAEPAFMSSCELLGLDPSNTVLFEDSKNPLQLKPWQVTGISFMLQRESSILRGGGISDSCGLGKTVQTLAAAYISATLEYSTAPFKPTLILCPASVVYVWALEALRFFKGHLRVYIYHRSKEQMSDPTMKDMIINESELGKFLGDLDQKSSNTGRTVVISSYTTWQNRTTIKIDNETGAKDSKKSKKICKFQDSFDRIVADEAHNLRSVYAETHGVVQSMSYKAIWFLTATPYLNKISDFGGYLHLLWQTQWKVDLPLASDTEDTDEPEKKDIDPKLLPLDPDAIRGEFKDVNVDEENLPVHLLCPDWFYALVYKGDVPIRDAWKVVPVLARIFFLKRTHHSMASYIVNGEEVQRPIGAEIPSHKICTVEVKFDDETQKEHNSYYKPLLHALTRPGGQKKEVALKDGLPVDKKDEGRVNFAAYRRLSHLAFSPKLERLAQNTSTKNLADEVRAWAEKWDDHGATFLYNKTKRDSAVLAPQDNMTMSYYLAWDSPKMQYFCRLVNEVVVEGKRRLTAVARWPQTFWVVYMVLRSLGLSVDTIHAGMKPEERAAALKKFCDRDSDSQIFLTTYACGGIGLNLHHTCADIVLLESAISVNIMRQACGRVSRLGQLFEQRIWILFQEHSFNRSEEFNAARKMINEISSTFAESFGDYVEKAINVAVKKQNERNGDKPTVGQKSQIMDSAGEAEADALISVCDELLRAMLGQPRSRLEWDDWEDLGLPDFDHGQKAATDDDELEEKESGNSDDDNAKKDNKKVKAKAPKRKKSSKRGIVKGRKTLRTPKRDSKKDLSNEGTPSASQISTPSKTPNKVDTAATDKAVGSNTEDTTDEDVANTNAAVPSSNQTTTRAGATKAAEKIVTPKKKAPAKKPPAKKPVGKKPTLSRENVTASDEESPLSSAKAMSTPDDFQEARDPPENSPSLRKKQPEKGRKRKAKETGSPSGAKRRKG